MDAKTQVLETMQKEGIPLNAGKIAELTNLDRKAVDKAMAELKADALIISPKRCYWQAK
jgi:DNA-binding IscR family transcriptional regulator